jgi:hypothetical protein
MKATDIISKAKDGSAGKEAEKMVNEVNLTTGYVAGIDFSKIEGDDL